MALELSVWGVCDIDGAEISNGQKLSAKMFFLRGILPISFKRDGVLCQRLSSSYSKRIECEDMCVFVYPSLLLLSST